MGKTLRAINASRRSAVAESVKRATSLWARSKGLLGRKGLADGEALLIEPCSGIHSFFMAFPFDAVFLDRAGTVVHLCEKMFPWRVSRYVFSARSVLELRAGAIRDSGTRVGDRFVFED